jgi:uncharacterized protein YjlB
MIDEQRANGVRQLWRHRISDESAYHSEIHLELGIGKRKVRRE